MVESSPQTKSDEQYPLLMVSGEGDGARDVPPTVVSSVWTVHNSTSKSPWRDRWPEFISACWVTSILLGISFLVFYIVGIIPAYSQQYFLLVKRNNTKPASDVYYHHITPRGSYAPFMIYADYLSHMATNYPLLCFNLYFLTDDSFQAFPYRHSGFYSRLMPYHPMKLQDEYNKREMRFFQKRHPNVNITVMPLSKFMATTPLKYKWRGIPKPYLPFYARIFSVWENGGIGIDLTTSNNIFNNHLRPDKRIEEILKEHNDGLKANGYANIFNMDINEKINENELISVFQDLFARILNTTNSFINKTVSFYPVTTDNVTSMDDQLIRSRRIKRETPQLENWNISNFRRSNETNEIQSILPANITNLNFTEMSESVNSKLNVTQFSPSEMNLTKKSFDSETFVGLNSVNTSDSNPAQIVLIYDFSVITDIGPQYQGSLPLTPSDFGVVAPLTDSDSKNPMKTMRHRPQYHLSIESEGLFVAASSRLHPLLGQIVCAGCRRMHPKFAIQDALDTQCSNRFKDDLYCNNIYVF